MINSEKDIAIKDRVKSFYDHSPFPDYSLERFSKKEDLELIALPMAGIIDRSIPKDSLIIDVGTGTGQLSAYLSLRRKEAWGIDFSDSSLNKAKGLKKKLNLDSLNLKKVDITNIKEIEAIGKKFDYVICLGVLHHTADPYQSFKNILSLLKPNGYIAIGLYNTYGRIPLKIRIFLAKTLFKNRNKIKDQFIKMQIGGMDDQERKRGWWKDQYEHPYESTHTVGQVLRWFDKNDIEFMGTIPSLKTGDSADLEIAGVWNSLDKKRPNILLRMIGQISWIWKTQHEGGYWITFGRKILFRGPCLAGRQDGH